ncbi:uncharacterized protein [Diadema setosum]|uniref:uncharacterized protein isoform X4 n=1 Tax=Diadema setosum TaxID=31175 RepID=UPI003B3A93D7
MLMKPCRLRLRSDMSSLTQDIFRKVVEFILPAKTGRWGSKHSIHEVDVCINRLQDSDGEAAGMCDLQISAYGPGVVSLRSEDLIECCPDLLSLRCEGRCPSSEVTAGSPISCVLKTQSCCLSSIIETEGGIPEVTVKSTPSSTEIVRPEFTVSLQCHGPASQLRVVMEQLQPLVYKYKIVHPMVVFQLLSCFEDSAKQFELRLERKPYITVSSHINVIVDVSFFLGAGRLPLPSCHRVVKPVSGGSFTFPFPSLCFGDSRPLLRCTAVGLLIPPGGPTDGVSPANWSQLWFSVYGPGSIPLAHPSTGSLEGILNLQHLVSWEDLGLALANEEAGQETGPKMPPIRDAIPDARLTLTSQTTSLPPLIVIMVFFKENSIGGTTSVQQKKDLLRRVRQEFPHIWAQQFGRIRGIVGDTLASLLGNPPARRDRKTVMEKAISLSSSALCSIITHSTNDNLRQHCLKHIQATNTKELGEKLVEKLTIIGMGPLGTPIAGVSQCGHGSQPQFPPKAHDEDETISALDAGNLDGVPEQLSPWQTTPDSAKMETLSGELGSDWFESLMEHDD